MPLIAGLGGSRKLQELVAVHFQLEKQIEQLKCELRDQGVILAQRNEELSQATSQLIHAEQRERDRLAQLLHDDLQQILVGARYGVQVLAAKLPHGRSNPAGRLMEALDEALRASRLLTAQLSPPVLQKDGLAEALVWLKRSMREMYGLQIDLTIGEPPVSVREEIGIFLYQSIRELLLNVVKHAGVRRARVELQSSGAKDRAIVVTVSDDGAGYDMASQLKVRETSSGFGLPAIHKRLGQLGGRMVIWSVPGRGSRFELICP